MDSTFSERSRRAKGEGKVSAPFRGWGKKGLGVRGIYFLYLEASQIVYGLYGPASETLSKTAAAQMLVCLIDGDRQLRRCQRRVVANGSLMSAVSR
jgi:hypothetical protein